MIILELFKKNRICTHDWVKPDCEFSYCPDCGELVENKWFITRCACCGVKLKATIKSGEVVPENHFCKNCGSEAFTVERVPKINFIDIDYAVLVKEVVKPSAFSKIQTWVDLKTANYTQELLMQYL